jgi:hypothetical protein
MLYTHRYLITFKDEGKASIEKESILRNSAIFSLLAQTSELPRDEVKTLSLTWCGENATWPLKTQSKQSWHCRVVENTHGDIIKDIEETLLIPRIRIVTVIIQPLTDFNVAVNTLGTELHYAFLKSINPQSLNATTSTTPQELDLTFNYIYSKRIQG